MNILVKDKKIYTNFLKLTVPIALQSLIALSAGLADSIMIGRYSEISFSAIAIVNKLQFFSQMFISGIASTIMVITTQYWGKKDTESIKDTTGIAMRISAIISWCIALFMFFLPKQYMTIFTDNPAVISEGITYMRIVAFTYLLFGPVQSLLATLRSIETVKVGFIISLFALSSNVALTYIFIFGKLGMPSLGVAGAAYPTLFAQILELILLLFYILNSQVKCNDLLKKTS